MAFRRKSSAATISPRSRSPFSRSVSLVDRFRLAFVAFDKDGSGTITADELNDFMNELGVPSGGIGWHSGIGLLLGATLVGCCTKSKVYVNVCSVHTKSKFRLKSKLLPSSEHPRYLTYSPPKKWTHQMCLPPIPVYICWQFWFILHLIFFHFHSFFLPKSVTLAKSLSSQPALTGVACGAQRWGHRLSAPVWTPSPPCLSWIGHGIREGSQLKKG